MNTYEIETLSALKGGALTLCLGSSTGANITGSLQVAHEIAYTLGRGKVLYINTVQTKRQLAASVRKMEKSGVAEEENKTEIEYLTSTTGALSELKELIRKYLERGVRFILINSLEFSSKDYR